MAALTCYEKALVKCFPFCCTIFFKIYAKSCPPRKCLQCLQFLYAPKYLITFRTCNCSQSMVFNLMLIVVSGMVDFIDCHQVQLYINYKTLKIFYVHNLFILFATNYPYFSKQACIIANPDYYNCHFNYFGLIIARKEKCHCYCALN